VDDGPDGRPRLRRRVQQLRLSERCFAACAAFADAELADFTYRLSSRFALPSEGEASHRLSRGRSVAQARVAGNRDGFSGSPPLNGAFG